MQLKTLRAEFPPLLHLALPLILGELGWIAMSVVDTAMLGRASNPALALAASALAQVLFNTLAFGIGGVLLALDALISQSLGEGDRPSANRWFLHGLALSLALSALLITLVAVLPRFLLLLPADRAVLAAAVPALRGLNYGVLPLLLYFALRRYLQAAHHGKTIMAALVSANLINAAGDWLLIYGHHWHLGTRQFVIPAFGVAGSSWATSAARLYLMLLLAVALALANRKHGYGLTQTHRRLDRASFAHLLRLGAPIGAQIFVEVAIFALATAVIATFGQVPLAGHEIALECASTTFMVPLAISGATAVRVGHAVGRHRAGLGDRANIAAAGWSGILAGAAFMLLFAAAFTLIPAPIAGLFTGDRAVIRIAVQLLSIAAAFQFFDGVQSTTTGALRGAGRTLAPLLVQLVCFWGIAMPLGTLLALPLHRGAQGMWWGLALGLTPAALVLVWTWHKTCTDHPPNAPPPREAIASRTREPATSLPR